jgi:5-methylcytosine-specific restriction protein B
MRETLVDPKENKVIRRTQIMDEEKLVNQIHDYIKTKGFNFELNLIKNYYISLKTKPFVILTGISGTGKTKLAEYFADAVVEDYDKQFKLIPVRPDWTDDKYLVGYYNPITQQYMSTDFIEFLIKAKLNPDNPYFVCLDEMNLARVEYYFSKFLSGLESKDHLINLHDLGKFTLDDKNKNEFIKWQKKQEIKEISKEEFENIGFVISHNGTLIPSKIEIPKNLYFTGTVNMDETTFQFSPKVLDRANTIEILGPSNKEDFFNRNEDIPDKTGIPEKFKTDIKKPQKYEWPEELKNKIWKLYEILQKDDTHRYDLHFGHRTVNEIGNYLGNSQGLWIKRLHLICRSFRRFCLKLKGMNLLKVY